MAGVLVQTVLYQAGSEGYPHTYMSLRVRKTVEMDRWGAVVLTVLAIGLHIVIRSTWAQQLWCVVAPSLILAVLSLALIGQRGKPEEALSA
jgi:hypothetical protein